MKFMIIMFRDKKNNWGITM